MRFDILTLFPAMFDSFVGEAMVKRAIEKNLISIHTWDYRTFSLDKHHRVDDRPYGGGPGMVLMCDPVYRTVEHVRSADPTPARLIALTPRGQRLDQQKLSELAQSPRLMLMCGRYEGFDERIYQGLTPEELSIGDFITNGGEVPAMVVIEGVCRLIPGFLGDEASSVQESHMQPGWLEYPQYTRPPNYRGMNVPDILLSGHHAAIENWRLAQATQQSKQD